MIKIILELTARALVSLILITLGGTAIGVWLGMDHPFVTIYILAVGLFVGLCPIKRSRSSAG